MPRRRFLLTALAVAAWAILFFPRRLAATVEEQRARLPPPATCTDPVEGEWRSHRYDERYHDWYIFTLRIKRSAPGSNTLVGDIQAHSWDSGPEESKPPACRPGLNHWTVYMTARGTLEGWKVLFGGTSWRVQDRFCGAAPGPGAYRLDNFSGTIDPQIQEFQSVNNDGGRSVNEPHVFRRIRCFDGPTKPKPRVAPPPFWPERRAGGCGWLD